MTISEVERKLAEYRARKERENVINHYRAKVESMLSVVMKKKDQKSAEHDLNTETKKDLLIPDSNTFPEIHSSDTTCEDSDDRESLEENTPRSLYDYIYYILWFLLWVTVYIIFIKLQFGIIYLIISGIVAMYLNTRTGPKRKNEISAYSVFNKNCESIDGTLKGEQLTKEILYGGFR